MLITTWKPLQWWLSMAIGLYFFNIIFFFNIGKISKNSNLLLSYICLFTGLNLRRCPSFLFLTDLTAPLEHDGEGPLLALPVS